jgi:hypothetical protein
MTSAIATEETVTKAYYDLKAKGEYPSIPRIIKSLGGGSRSTIAPILKELRDADERHKTEAFRVNSTLDPTQLGTIASFVAYTVEKAQEKFQSDLVSSLENALETRNKELEDMTQLMLELKAELKATKDANDKLHKVLEDMNNRLSRLESK